MKIPATIAATMGLAVLMFAASPAAISAQGAGPSPELAADCASCHALTKPDNPTLEHVWERKGPDLWYAGDKFNRAWLVSWLQEPTAIRPGGVNWFKHTRSTDKGDQIDTDAIEKHPKLDAAKAEKFADALMQLKSDGLVPEGAYDPGAANARMGKLGFTKLRGCISCHQDVPGTGGLSGPSFTDASKRLNPDYVLAYTKDPQKFDPHVWMPTLELSDVDLQRITGYIISLGKEDE